MPGVNVTTATRSGPSTPLRAQSGQVFMAGLAERGAVGEPILLRGMADYERHLGDRVAYGSLYDALRVFFDEGGVQAYVTRVVGTNPTVGALSLSDRAATTPLPTLRVDAANPGAWSSRMEVEVRDGAVANTFRITIYLDGEVVEDRTNLSSPTEAVARFTGSPYVTLVNLGSATAAPNNNPRVLARSALSAGTDDRATVVAATYVAALNNTFVQGLGDGAVAIPGQGPAVHDGLIAHAKLNRRIALLSMNLGTTIDDYIAVASSTDSDAAGLFGPWLTISDEVGGTRQVSPEGYVAAVRARAHEQIGPWRAPAGQIAQASSLLGLEVDYTRTEGDRLDAGRVSVIRNIGGTVRLYGWRSLSSDETNFGYLSGRDILNRLVVEGEKRLEEYVFAPIDGRGQLLSAINASLVGIVEPIRQAGGLYENINPETAEIIDPGYRVETGSSVNTAESLAANEIKARLSVRVAPTGALVSLTIVKVGVLAGL